MIGFKMNCERCKKELKKIPLKEAVKKREWWKQEFKDFGWSNLLILVAILLIFSTFYFEFGPKVKNPCDWCKVRIEQYGEVREVKCIDWYKQFHPEDFNEELDLEINYGVFENENV
jgi:hypothetical protein